KETFEFNLILAYFSTFPAAFRNSLLILGLLMFLHLEQASKIAYKKPLYGKSNYIKEKKFRSKGLKVETTTAAATSTSTTSTSTTSTSTTEEDWPSAVEFVIMATTPRSELEASEEALNNGTSSTIETSVETSSSRPGEAVESFNQTTMPTMSTTTSSSLINTLPSPPMGAGGADVVAVAVAVASPPVPDNQPVPCTCGVFLSSQIPNGLPTAPLINQELDRMFPCNAIGRKQCQTKCLEAIVQHLPNSANIVCSALGHDCHKERAYLFIKNCHNQWVNTNLQAGREYCCRGGVPYRCPLMG
ncbi:hypothetical protein KR054_000751, partial [Drosophila jambulina]